MGESLVDDATFDRWAYELTELQAQFPIANRSVEFHREAFADFRGDTGFHLPLDEPATAGLAQQLLRLSRRRSIANGRGLG